MPNRHHLFERESIIQDELLSQMKNFACILQYYYFLDIVEKESQPKNTLISKFMVQLTIREIDCWEFQNARQNGHIYCWIRASPLVLCTGTESKDGSFFVRKWVSVYAQTFEFSILFWRSFVLFYVTCVFKRLKNSSICVHCVL